MRLKVAMFLAFTYSGVCHDKAYNDIASTM